MSATRKITDDEAREVRISLGIDDDRVDLEQFRLGLEVELEHGARSPRTDVTHDDLGLTGKIAWAHLNEFPDYYTRLAKLELEASVFWAVQK